MSVKPGEFHHHNTDSENNPLDEGDIATAVSETIIEEAATVQPVISTKDADLYFPQLFGKRRTGESFVRKNKFGKTDGSRGGVLVSFEIQDHVKNTYRDEQIKGNSPRFAVALADDSEIRFGEMFSDWLLTNSTIATLSRNGWFVYVV